MTMGRFGTFGGRYVPETLVPALDRLIEALPLLREPAFHEALAAELRDWVGRPTALTPCPALSRAWGAQVLFKREDLAHTGAHKINAALGQVLLARKLGARRVVAETGAGQHGVAVAAACARVGLPATVYMGSVDVARQALNVRRMELFGATVVPVSHGDATLRAAIDEALRDWVTDPDHTYYALGSVVGPHPYPTLVRELQAVIGREARAQVLSLLGRLPDLVVACVGGGSNAIGLFHAFLADPVRLVGVEASPGAATVARGREGVLHGCRTLLLQDGDGQVHETHSISAGLDYAGVGPEHAHLAATGRASYVGADDEEALAALRETCQREGILPALESAHAIAGAKRLARENPGAVLLVGCSGRGDKDLALLEGR
jgi:tryptophan synthase beta chain